MGSLAYAQEGAAATGPGPLVQFLPLLLVFAVFYFLLIRPQQQKAKAHRVMLGNLKRNDEVVTAGGLYGKIVELGETDVRLEIASNVRVRIDRMGARLSDALADGCARLVAHPTPHQPDPAGTRSAGGHPSSAGDRSGRSAQE